MRVTREQFNSVSAAGRTQPTSREAAPGDAAKTQEPTSSCRALIPLSPVRFSERTPAAARQAANFLAHLIATDQAIPQTRERRRVEPGVAAALYAAARDTLAPADRETSAPGIKT